MLSVGHVTVCSFLTQMFAKTRASLSGQNKVLERMVLVLKPQSKIDSCREKSVLRCSI